MEPSGTMSARVPDIRHHDPENDWTRDLRQLARDAQAGRVEPAEIERFWSDRIVQPHIHIQLRPYPVIQAWDYATCLRPAFHRDKRVILPRIIRFLVAAVPSPDDPRDILGALKLLALVGEKEDLASLDCNLEALLFSVIESACGQSEISLVAGTTLAKVILRQWGEDDQSRCIATWLEYLRKSAGFTRVCLTEGILNCSPPRLIFRDDNDLFEELFQSVTAACGSVTSYAYQSFHSLKILTQRIFDAVRREERAWLETEFASDSRKTQKILQITMANWENPLRGVPDIVQGVLKNVIEIAKALDAEPKFTSFVQGMLRENMAALTWKNKSKYPVLLTLLAHVPIFQVLLDHPEFGVGLSESLGVTHLIAIGASLYKLIMKTITPELWRKHFQCPLITSLCSSNPIVANNVKLHWMPCTVQRLPPASLETLVQSLESDLTDASKLSGILCIFKVQRQVGTLEELSATHYHFIERGLVHSCNSVRRQALAVICHLKKRCVPPSLKDLELISTFVNRNLTVDSASFRQVFMSDLTLVFIRCRDSLAPKARKQTIESEGMGLLIKLNDILESLFKNCFPGANYQRLITCLEIMEVFNNIFFRFNHKGVNKESGNGNPQDLIQFCAAQKLLDFYSWDHFAILLACTSCYMTDVRELARHILEGFQPDRSVIKAVLQRALSMVCSPKFGECEGGACLMQLVGSWSQNGTIADICLDLDYQNAILAQHAPAPQSMASTCHLALALYKNLLASCESEFLIRSKSCPMHGLLTGIRFCLDRNGTDWNQAFLSELVHTLELSVKIMLGVLSCENDEVVSPSFAAMDEAIEDLLDDTTSPDSVEFSVDHQLVLACAWLNLKECSLVSGELVKISTLGEAHFGVDLVEKCGDILTSVLTRCRHKGALEATMAACFEFSSRLLAHPNPQFHMIPRNILLRTLDQIEHYSASITRRSAGLPMLITKIVVSEPKGRTRTLLGLAISRLIGMTHSIPKVEEASETQDQAQGHALHILRSLVHDSIIAHDIMSHVPEILTCCVDQFESSHWTVRNAALQLFGSLAPRILGQKKVRSDESISNAISVHEFVSRFSSIIPFVLRKLFDSAAVDKNRRDLINPALVPLLSLLSKISPSEPQGREKDLSRTTLEFRQAFHLHLASPVINVRMLAAKSFAKFTPPSQMLCEVGVSVSRLQGPIGTNFRHGLLLSVRSLLSLNKDVNGTLPAFEESMKKLMSSSEPCFVNQNVMLDICNLVEIRPPVPSAPLLANSSYRDPGFHEWRARTEVSGEVVDIRSRHDLARKMKDLREDPPTLVDFLAEHLDSQYINGQVLVQCHEAIRNRAEIFVSNPEAALDLLDLVTDERLAARDHGQSANTALLVSSSTAFVSMMLQADFNMFFRDDSLYCSHFMEFTEKLLTHSEPKHIETSRLDCARAILGFLPVFNGRILSVDFPLVMQYGFINILNVCFTLLVDGDPEIRGTITRFVSGLEFPDQPADFPSLGTLLCQEKLVFYGLDRLPDCREWFEPVLDTCFLPWRESNAELLEAALQRKHLFESGEGINVYSEDIAANLVYSSCLDRWLASNDIGSIGLDVGRILHEAQSIVALLPSNESKMKCFSSLWAHGAYLVISRMWNFLKILHDHPSMMKLEPETQTQIGLYLKVLSPWLMHI